MQPPISLEWEMQMKHVGLCRAIAAIAAVFLAIYPRAAGATDAVSFRLDWTLSGYHLPFYWAKEKGYYAAENLAVDIKEGAGSGKTVALMAGQQNDVGLADFMFMSVGAAKGMKIKGIFGEVQDGAWAIVSRAEAPVKKPEDLIGKSVATTADHKAMLDLLLAINKIPPDKVNIRVTSAATRNTVFVNGQVDSFISVVIGSPLDLVVRAQQGKDKPVHFMPFAEFGIAPMGQGLLAHERVIAERPEMLRRFVKASARALNEVVKPENTEEAVNIAMRLSDARDERRESVKLQWLETVPRLRTKNTEGRPYGWMSEKDWAVSVDILLKTGQLEKPIPTQSLFTNDFVPAN
jgi:NitT/TauT family transport system substrate-binding protein